MHLIVEGKDRVTLARGMQGLLIRLTKRLNALWQRSGRVLSDRYHDRILRTPREVRNAVAYVLRNAHKHGVPARAYLDPCSSSPWFDGWRERRAGRKPIDQEAPVTAPRTWLLQTGWRHHGLIPLSHVPRKSAPP
jgi:hypothetical protein